jgi:hypothetical protein
LELEESSTDVVNQIWQAAAAPGAQLESAVNDVFPFTEYYPKFAEYAWNQDPHDEFILEDQIVPHAPVYGGSPENVTLGGGTEAVEYEAPALVNWLSSHFFHYKFTDESVRSATFHNTLLDQPDAAVTAFIKVDGNWSEEDWSEMEQAFFCRDLADENIEELVVIISNTDWQNNRERLDPEDNPSLEASAVGCKGWIGDLSAEVEYNDARAMMLYYWETMDACVPPAAVLEALRTAGQYCWPEVTTRFFQLYGGLHAIRLGRSPEHFPAPMFYSARHRSLQHIH